MSKKKFSETGFPHRPPPLPLAESRTGIERVDRKLKRDHRKLDDLQERNDGDDEKCNAFFPPRDDDSTAPRLVLTEYKRDVDRPGPMHLLCPVDRRPFRLPRRPRSLLVGDLKKKEWQKEWVKKTEVELKANEGNGNKNCESGNEEKTGEMERNELQDLLPSE